MKLFAKLFFSANKIPETEDESDAYYRREIIISFPNRFEGENQDPNLLRKLTTEDEVSGIFNVLVRALKPVLKNGIHQGARTIEERREKYQLAVDPISFFLNEAVLPESTVSDMVIKDELYEAYKQFCEKYLLAVESKISFGKKIKVSYDEHRETSGERRRTMWKGIRLTKEYSKDSEQQELTV